MEKLSQAPCSECSGKVERRNVMHEYERGGVRVRLYGIEALVCEQCGAEYSLPGEAQKMVEAVNSLFEVAQRNGQHKGKMVAAVERESVAA